MKKIMVNLSPKQMLKMKRQEILASNEGYLQGLQMALKNIKKLDPEDRLGYASGVYMLVHAMGSSIEGWEKWNDVITLDGLTLKQYKEIFPEMKKITEKWLEIDYKITKAKTKSLEKEFAEMDEASEEKEEKEKDNPLSI